MKKGLRYAIREEIFSTSPQIYQTYPLNKNFLLFFLFEFLENDEDIDQEDQEKILSAIGKVQQENFQLQSNHQRFYDSFIEREFLKKNPSFSMKSQEHLLCQEWAKGDLIRLQASKELSELFLFDLF